MHRNTSSKLAAFVAAIFSFFAVFAAQANTATIMMTQPGKSAVQATSYSVSEAQGTFLLPVTISQPLQSATGSVLIATQDITAVSGTNYWTPGQPYISGTVASTTSGTSYPVYSGTYTLTWNSGDPVTKYVSIPIIDSGVANANPVKFNVILVNGTFYSPNITGTGGPAIFTQVSPAGALTATSSGTANAANTVPVTILGAHSTTTTAIKMHNSDYILREPSGTGTAQLSVQIDFMRAGDPNQVVGVSFDCNPGSATPGKNYVRTNGFVTVSGTTMVARVTTGGVQTSSTTYAPFGSGSAVINIPILRDPAIPASTPQFTFILSSPQNGIVSRRSSTISVLDIDTPIPAVQFSTQEVYIAQPVSPATAVVTLKVYHSGTSGGASFPFGLSTADGSALAGTDYTAITNGAFTLTGGTAVGSEFTSVPITISYGQQIQPLYFTASLTGSTTLSGTTLLGDVSQCAVYITTAASALSSVQFESPTYLISQAPDTINTAQLTVQRSGNLNQTTNVSFLTVPGTAQAGIDYVSNMGTLVFNPGDVSKVIDITINPSSSVTGPLAFSVALSNVSTPGAVGSGSSNLGAYATTIVTISPAPQTNQVSFISPSYAVTNSGTSYIGVQLDRNAADPTQPVTVQVYTQPGTAASGVDFVPIAQSAPLTLAFTTDTNGVPINYLTVPVVTNRPLLPQDARYFDLVLQNPVNGVLGDQSSAEIDITPSTYGTVQFTTTDVLVGASQGSVGLTVTLVRTGSGTITVPYVLVPGTAAQSRFYDNSGGSISFPNGVSQTQINVGVINDGLVEPPQTFLVSLRASTSGTYTLGTNSTATVTITNSNGDNTVQFENAIYGDTEPSPTSAQSSATPPIIPTKVVPIRVRATRNGGMNVQLAVDYQLVAGTAVAGTDYVWDPSANHTVTFAAGESVADIPITILGDYQTGFTKTFTINLVANQTPAGATTGIGAQQSALFKMYEADVPTNHVQFLAPEITTTEGGPALIIPVIRNGAFNNSDSSATYQTRLTPQDPTPYGDTAQPGSEFTATQGTVNFAIIRDDVTKLPVDQESLKYITVPILDNGKVTGELFFTIWITGANNCNYGSQLTCRINIRDAEMGNLVNFQQSAFQVTRSGTLNVNGVPTVTGTNVAAITVVLLPTGNTTITNTVQYQFQDVTAINGVDYFASNGTLIFSPSDFATLQSGSPLSKVIFVPLNLTSRYPGQSKQFTVSLLNPSSGVVLGGTTTANVTISDPYNKTLPEVDLLAPLATSTINEGITSGSGIFVVSRTGDTSSPLTVNYIVLGTAIPGPVAGGASNGYDYTMIGTAVSGTPGVVSSGSVIIPAGASSISVPVVPNGNINSKTSVTVQMKVDVAPVDPSDAYGRGTYLVGAANAGVVTLLPLNTQGMGVSITSSPVVTATSSGPVVGDQVTFTITIDNSFGSADANDVVVTQTLPGNVTYVSSDWGDLVTSATQAGSTVLTIPVGIVPSEPGPGSTYNQEVIHTIVQVNAPVTFKSTVQIQSSNPDTNTYDDSASTQVSVKRASTTGPSVSIGGADAYELTPLVSANGTAYLGSYPGSFEMTRGGDTALPLNVKYQVDHSHYTRYIGTNGTCIVTTSGTALTTISGTSVYVTSGSTITITTGSNSPVGSGVFITSGTGLTTSLAGSLVIPSGRVVDNRYSVITSSGTSLSITSGSGIITTSGSIVSIVGSNSDVTTDCDPSSYSIDSGAVQGGILVRAGTNQASMLVWPNHNPAVTGNQTVTMDVLPDATYALGSPSVTSITIFDADVPLVGVTALGGTASNLNPSVTGTGLFRVTRYNAAGTLANATAFELPVNFTVAGTAQNGYNYDIYLRGTDGSLQLLAGTSLTIPAGQDHVDIVVSGHPQVLVNGPSTVVFTVTDATQPANNGTTIQQAIAYSVMSGRASATVTVVDPDMAEVGVVAGLTNSGTMIVSDTRNFTFSGTASKYTAWASELAPPMYPAVTGTVPAASIRMAVVSGTFYVTRNDSFSKPFTTTNDLVVNYTLGGTAKTGTDYDIYISGTQSDPASTNANGNGTNVLKGTVTIPHGMTSIAIEVRPKANSLIDGSRTVIFTVAAATASTAVTVNGVSYTPPVAYGVRSDQTAATVTISDKPTVFLSQSTSDRTAVQGGKSGGLTFNRQGSGIANGMVVPFTMSGLGVYGVDYWLYQDATAKSPRMQIKNYMLFPVNITQVHVTLVPISHSGTAMIDPVILQINATSYFQYPTSTYRGAVNILRGY